MDCKGRRSLSRRESRIVRNFLTLPIDVLRILSAGMRKVLCRAVSDCPRVNPKDGKYTCMQLRGMSQTDSESSHFDTTQIDINVVRYSPPLPLLPITSISNVKEKVEYIVVYLHGGAFTLDDCADLMLAERLLPALSKGSLGDGNNGSNGHDHVVSLYTIMYPMKATGVEGTYSAIQHAITSQYKWIASNGAYPISSSSSSSTSNEGGEFFKREIICIMGDSAGGNLALSQTLALLKEDMISSLPPGTSVPPVVLISPWVNPLQDYSKDECYLNESNEDYINADWAWKSQLRYYGEPAGYEQAISTCRQVLYHLPSLAPIANQLLVVYGEKEVIASQVKSFVDRVDGEAAAVSSDLRITTVVGVGELHCYPLLWNAPNRMLTQWCVSVLYGLTGWNPLNYTSADSLSFHECFCPQAAETIEFMSAFILSRQKNIKDAQGLNL